MLLVIFALPDIFALRPTVKSLPRVTSHVELKLFALMLLLALIDFVIKPCKFESPDTVRLALMFALPVIKALPVTFRLADAIR